MILRFSWWIMINPWSNDKCNFKILMLTKNDEVWLYIDHSWLFCPIQLIFNHLSNWLSKFVLWGLKLGMDIFWGIWRSMKSTWGLGSSISFEEIKTLIWGPLLRRSVCMVNPWVVLSFWNSYECEETSWVNLSQRCEGKFWGTTSFIHNHIHHIYNTFKISS